MMSTEQEYLLKLLHEIDDICKKHNIKYYLAGGTVLGAIRHKGFIPWDDDMDLYMTRDEYLRFVKVCSEELPKDRFLECQELNRDYPNMFSRYTDCNTCTIHKNQIFGNSHAGGIIDILQLDPIFDDPKVQKQYNRDMMLYSDLLNIFVVYSNRYEHNQVRYRWYRLLMKLFGKEKILRSLEKRMLEYDEEKCTKYAMRWGGASFYFDKDMFGWGRFAQFEDMMCPIPVRSNDYLTWHYGDDWTTIPPHADRAGHDAVMSLTHNYKEVQEMYKNLIDKDNVLKAYAKRKLHYIEHSKPRHRVSEDTQRIKAVAIKQELLRRISNQDLRQLLNDINYTALANILEPFLKYQFDRNTIGREDFAGIYRFLFPVRVQVDDNILFVSSKYLLQTNRVAKAQRLIDLRVLENPDKPLPQEIQDICDFIIEFRKSVSFYDAGDKDSSLKLCNHLLEVNPHVMSLIKLKLRILFDFGEQYYDEARPIVENALSIDQFDGEYHKFMGDIILSKGNIVEAFNTYSYAFSNSLNGYMHLEVTELFAKYEQNIYSIIDEMLNNKEYQKCLEFVNALKVISKNNDKLKIYEFTSITKFGIDNKNEDILWSVIKSIKKQVNSNGWNDNLKNLFCEILTYFGESEENIQYRVEVQETFFTGEYDTIIDKLSKIDTITAKKLLADVLYKRGDHLEAVGIYNDIASSKMSKIVKYELKTLYSFSMNRLARLLIVNDDTKRRISYLLHEWKLKFNDWNTYNNIVQNLEIPVTNLMLSKQEIKDKLVIIRETIQNATETLNNEDKNNLETISYNFLDALKDNNELEYQDGSMEMDNLQDLEVDASDMSNADNDNMDFSNSDDEDIENVTINLINASKEERYNLYYTYIYNSVMESEAVNDEYKYNSSSNETTPVIR